MAIEGKTDLLTADETARELRISTDHLYRLVKSKRLPHVRVGRTYRFDLHEVLAALRGTPDEPPAVAS